VYLWSFKKSIDMGSIISVLFVIVVIVSSIYKKVVKPVADEMEKTTLPGRKSGREIHFPENKPVESSAPVVKKKPVNKTVSTNYNPNISQPILIEEPQGEKKAFLDIDDSEEIKKAIVYSEIFGRRKY
jgi:hypothetical protein